MSVAIVTLNAVCVVVSDSWSHDSLGTMSIFTFTVVIALFSVPSFQGIKKCEKIDTCRCSTDEGEINLWSLAGETTNQPRFRLAEAFVANFSGETKDSYQWNPCKSWTAKTFPNETAENTCKDIAVCLTRKTDPFGTLRVNIGEQKLSDCVLDQDSGQCVLTYSVKSDPQTKTSITLVCNENEAGRVDPMSRFSHSFHTSLYSKCACPGKCSGLLSTGAVVGIAVGSAAALLLLSFAVFICCLRRRLPDGAPKPSMCTTIKVGCGILTAECCPCCRRCKYSAIPGK